MMRALLRILALLAIAGCSGAEDHRDVPKAKPVPAASGDSTQRSLSAFTGQGATRLDSLPPLADAPSELASDTIPVAAPDGKPARYGIASGRLFGRFSGDARGTRTIVFDQWGLRERKEENIAPYPETKSVAINNTIFITTPTSQAYADMRTRQGFRRQIDGLHAYNADPKGRTMSFGDWIARRTDATRLADTTISRYRTKTYRRQSNGVITTVWLWRGLPIRELVEVPNQKVRYLFEPLEIDVDMPTESSMFEFPAGYTISPFQ